MRIGRRCRRSVCGSRLPWVACVLALACAPGNPAPAEVATPSAKTPAKLVCSPDQATPAALAKAGTLGDGTALLASGEPVRGVEIALDQSAADGARTLS